MQKNRNRSVKNNFEFSSKFLESLPNVETVKARTSSELSQLGESVSIEQNDESKIKKHSTFSFDRDSLTNESDLDILSFGKSSSSSISWSDDFDVDATKRVQQEFERMERILQGKEPIPLHYNKDEYKQWISTFPQLSVIGYNIRHFSTDPKNIHRPNDHFEELIAYDSDNEYLTSNDKSRSSAELKKLSRIKKHAIDEVFKKISNQFVNASSLKVDEISKHTRRDDYKSLSTPKFTNHIKTSPVFSKNPLTKIPILKMHPSSNSISKSEKFSKWMYESPNKYASLPYIKCAKNKTNKPSVRKKSSANSRYSSNVSPYRSNCVSLPPIKTTLNVPPVKQYRSISTTPRNPTSNTTTSASISLHGKSSKHSKNIFDVNKFEQKKM
ncbi:hypothetical protein FQR65_LT04762 [Abscondita terminalis]|nr:hypothetical protein FQR65_LT04762 [Abscondita terminalis]